MTREQLLSALLAFLLGLLAKLIYDIWSESRKKKSLLFVKTILSSFTLSSLEESIRKQTQVMYQGHPIKSIHLARIEIENDGASVVRNQAFTVRFCKEASIIGEPHSESSSEDLRYIERDLPEDKPNSRRFIIKLLQKGRRVAWDLAVINHEGEDFVVEPGLASVGDKATGVDFDVSSTVTREKVQLDLAGRIRRIIALLVTIQVITLVRNSFVFGLYDLIKPVANVLIVSIWFLVIREVEKAIVPFMNWIRGASAPREVISVGDSVSSSIVVSSHGKAELTTIAPDEELAKRLVSVIETSSDQPSLSQSGPAVSLPEASE